MIAGLVFFAACAAFSIGFLVGAWWGSKTGLETEEDYDNVDE